MSFWSLSETPPVTLVSLRLTIPGTAVPLGFCTLGMTLGAYLGGCEGKPMMNAALLSREIEGVHVRLADRAPQEDAMVSFIRSGRGSGSMGK